MNITTPKYPKIFNKCIVQKAKTEFNKYAIN